MNEIKRDGEVEPDSGVRAGGDVQTKGPSKDASSDESTVRAGGDVQTKGPSRDKADSDTPQSE